jgi:thiamine transport system substrate-binding protein
MRRRDFLRIGGVGGATGLVAGCLGGGAEGTDGSGGSSGGGDGTTGASTSATEPTTGAGTAVGSTGSTELVVATYSSFVDAPSSSPGPWLKERFEAEFDATLTWETPENGVNYFIERQLGGAGIDADAYVGLDTNMLIRIDEKLTEPLFAPVEEGAVSRRGEVNSSLEFDPQGRAVPYDTGYICLVWNERETTAPETFDGLLDPAHAGELIVQNPTSSATGTAFLLHTVAAKGEDAFVDYWRALKDNDVRVLGNWEDAYNAYSNGEAPMVVSYSTDQVFANEYGEPMEEHQLRFLNDQGYANPEGMARFAGSSKGELVNEFMDFVLSPEIQAGIAVRNVQFPATTTATLPDDFAEFAHEPPEAVTFTYDELKGSLGEWTDAWARAFASK